jgi:nicotinate-nucleotide adenylyltransferase
MKFALLGGTFNPIHNGHLFIAEEVLVSLGYDRILFIPAFKPAHKSLNQNDDPEKRLAMVRLALKGRKEFLLEDCEIRRQGTSYTMETIDYMLDKYPIEGKPGLIIGDDLLSGFSTWKMVDRLLATVKIIIAHREKVEKVPFPGDHQYIGNSLLPVSSSEIRRRVKERQAFRYLLPESVYEYICREGVYREY